MKTISDLKFTAVAKGDKVLSGKKLEDLVSQLDNWEITDYGGSDALYKVYQLGNFIDAQRLAKKFGVLAESYDHHPIISYTWGKLEVYWFTHSLKGIHLNDVFLADQTEKIAQNSKLLVD